MQKRRILVTVAALLLAGGTALVFAEEKGPMPGGPGGEPKGSPSGEPKGAPKTADPKAKNGGPGEKAEPKGKAPPAKDKAEPKEKAEPKPKAEPKDKAPTPKDKASEPKDKAPKADKAEPKSKDGKGAAKITTEQRTEIRQTIIKQGKGPRVTKVDFSISVGVSVPRTVKVAVLPPRVIEIYPAWRGYRYFIYEETIIIIDDGWRIVFIIET
jgi:hypothetical protein